MDAAPEDVIIFGQERVSRRIEAYVIAHSTLSTINPGAYCYGTVPAISKKGRDICRDRIDKADRLLLARASNKYWA